MAKIRKRSKHLVIQDNPFREKEIPKPTTPTNKKPSGDADNSAWRAEQKAQLMLNDYRAVKPEDLEKTAKISFKGQGMTNDVAVTFYGFVESLSENFSTNFQQIEKIGSPEPIHQYSGTSKEINISWKAFEDDYNNLSRRIDTLKELVYPTVDESGIPTQPPVLIMSYGALTEEYARNPKRGELTIDLDPELVVDTENADTVQETFIDTAMTRPEGVPLSDRWTQDVTDPRKGGMESNVPPLPRKSKEVFGYITSLGIDYSSQEMGYAGDVSKPREVSISVSFKQINRGITGTFRHGQTTEIGRQVNAPGSESAIAGILDE